MDVRLAALAARQGGVFGRAQALARGETRGNLAAKVGRGQLHRHGHAFVVAGAPPGEEHDLWRAQLAIGPPVALTGAAAARLHGLARVPRPARIRAVVPASRRSGTIAGVQVSHAVPADLAGVRVLGGHPVTSLPVTLRLLAAEVPQRLLEEVVADVLLRRTTTAELVRAALGQGRRGSTALRRALAAVGDESQSGAERALARLLVAHGVPPPERHAELRGPGAKTYRPDFLWRWARLGVEVDGWLVHGSRTAFGYDRFRANRPLVDHGIELLRYPADRIRDDADGVVTEIAVALRRRGWGEQLRVC